MWPKPKPARPRHSLSTPGSTWIAGSRLADAARDVRASQVDDVLTIVVAEAASAVSTGSTQTVARHQHQEQCERAWRHHPGHRTAGQSGERLGRYGIEGHGLHRAHHHIEHHADGARNPRTAQRRPGRRGFQGHPDQLGKTDHHRARRDPCRPISISPTACNPRAWRNSKSASTARAWWATPFAGLTFSTVFCWGFCPFDMRRIALYPAAR